MGVYSICTRPFVKKASMQTNRHMTQSTIAQSKVTAVTENVKSCISAFFIYDEVPSTQLQEALESINAQHWALMQLHIDDAIAMSFRVIKLPSLILHNEMAEETARVFGEQNIIEMIGRVFDE